MVKWCNNTEMAGYRVHEFPKAEKLFSVWRQCIHLVHVKRANSSNQKLPSDAIVCGSHFIKCYLKNWGVFLEGLASNIKRQLHGAVIKTVTLARSLLLEKLRQIRKRFQSQQSENSEVRHKQTYQLLEWINTISVNTNGVQ